MSPHDHLSSFDASFSDSFSEDLIRQFDHKTEAIRNALNEEELPSPPTPQPQQEHDQSPPPSPKEAEKVEPLPQPPPPPAAVEEEEQGEKQKLTVIVPERELRPSRSRFFRSPKKMKSLSRLFTTAREQEEEQELPRVASPWSATTTQNSSPSSTIFGNICQYPPRPLQYSTDVSPPAENGDELALKSRRSCTLKPTTPEPSEQRRSSAPALPPRPAGKHRVFAFLWSK